jgi:hypothetical protein
MIESAYGLGKNQGYMNKTRVQTDSREKYSQFLENGSGGISPITK